MGAEVDTTSGLTARPVVPRALAVADSPGHILERIGQGWARHGQGAVHDVATSLGETSHALVRRAAGHDLVHWLDQIRFESAGPALGRPQVVMVHHLVEDMHRTLLPRLGHADALATASEGTKARLEDLLARPVTLLPYAVDCATFRPPSEDERRRSRQGRVDRFVAGFVGKAAADHDGRKGVDLLVEVAREAARTWPDFALLLVGPGWEELEGRLQGTGVSTERRVFPRTEEMVEAYWAMDALLVTSREEGGPCTTLEAMATGVPVIASPVGHVPETIQDGETGFLCPRREAGEYGAALRTLRGDRDRGARVAAEARARVVATLDERVLVPRLDFASLYQEATRRFARRGAGEHARRRLRSALLFFRHVAHHAVGGPRPS